MKYSEMCEHIVKAQILEVQGVAVTDPQAVFNYSPSGELFMLEGWYEQACAKLGVCADGSPYRQILGLRPDEHGFPAYYVREGDPPEEVAQIMVFPPARATENEQAVEP